MPRSQVPVVTPIAGNLGLSEAEARRRLESDGPNDLARHESHGFLRLLGQVLAEPMFLLLIGAVALYLILGDRREAAVLALSLLVILVITIVQEQRTEHALRALRDLSSPRAAVLRDGVVRRIAGYEVVRGDVLLLAEGDRVPADGVVRAATDLWIDESLLTGESAAVAKLADNDLSALAPPNDDKGCCVYAGTLVVRGHGTAEVLATGMHTQFGRIGHALTSLLPEKTPLYLEIHRLIRWVATIGVGVCVIVTVLYALLRDGWLHGALAGITLAMSVLPEEFPVVLTVFMALGAWRLSKRGVLTRRLPAIEALGAATVLAMDKTGTLTENRMSVAILETASTRVELGAQGTGSIDGEIRNLLAVAHAACELEAFDPMERAIRTAAMEYAASLLGDRNHWRLIREYDLVPELPAVTHVWRDGPQRALRIATKGAPEAVLSLCHIDEATRHSMLRKVEELAQDGLRVLCVAEGSFDGETLPESPRAFSLELRGLLALRDPVRTSVPAALAECRRAGIRAIMITGDHPRTARSIARAAGLDSAAVATGTEIAAASDTELRQLVAVTSIFARTTPEQKLRLVRALRDNGEIVAMIGDGVNDAPALRAAHIGIAMGGRGTDVAREAAALVLLDDELGSVVAAVGAGRGIYENIRAAMTYLLAVHLPLAGMGLSPLLFGWPLLLFPLHVAFLEFIIDPACSLVFENEQRGDALMRRPPRDPRDRMLSKELLLESLTLGTTSLLAVALVYAFALRAVPEPQARALGFITLVISNLALISVARMRSTSLATIVSRRNVAFWLVNVGAFAALICVVSVPAVAHAFRFDTPSPLAMLAAFVTAVVGVTWTRAVRILLRKPST
jgi:Ca2+-transporting ATPase